MSRDKENKIHSDVDKTSLHADQFVPSQSSPFPNTDFGGGSIVGQNFKIVRPLGAGGMSTVYEALDLRLQRSVALKVLSPKLQKNQQSLKRFDIEARATSRLSQKNIVQVYEYGIHEGQPFLAMEYIPGRSLAEILDERAPLPISEAISVVMQVCDALENAHNNKIIHRDLKPTNIMLVDGDTNNLRIVDFGIARILSDTAGQDLTKTGDVFGSPLYMSPEQCSGQYVDKQSDIYSLGCIMYECLTGQPPHVGANALATIIKHQQEAPISLREATLGGKFPPELERIVGKMLAKKPQDRYRCAEELKFDLERFNQNRSADDNPWADGAMPPGTDFFKDVQRANLRNLQKLDLRVYEDAQPKSPWLQSYVPLLAGLVGAIVVSAGWYWWQVVNVSKQKAPVDVSTMNLDQNKLKQMGKLRYDKLNKAMDEEFVKSAAELLAQVNENSHLTTLDCTRKVLSPKGWMILEKFKNLKQINLTDSSILGGQLQSLSGLPLQDIDLTGIGEMNLGLPKIKSIKTLRILCLVNTDVSDTDLDNVNPNVEDLALNRNHRLTAAGINKLTELPHLKRLSVASFAKGEEMRKVLSKFTSLEYLSLRGNNIKEYVDRLRTALPHCVIDYRYENDVDPDER